MTGGTEYIVHDIDENNVIIGKARISGTVRVPDEIAVEGFLARDSGQDDHLDGDDDEDDDGDCGSRSQDGLRRIAPPTFHPPSFGVTVLGNSHGFDKNGSTSGYVLWINGRGVMIDPPPYSSATLEREGIRPQMIMAIIITHCHADHDAGTFQKVMTGSRVAIITTPTIYKSFIRKYAALSGLSPTLLRHSHRHRPAIIGQPLKFQGATFYFTYTLHTIPCIAFRVEWRGRSIVFTGDHLNSPPVIESLESLVSGPQVEVILCGVQCLTILFIFSGCCHERESRRSASIATSRVRRFVARSWCSPNSYTTIGIERVA
jgi:glyoxylase-like metal-dependent hydrolase (beta-lactamase superfamily II)